MKIRSKVAAVIGAALLSTILVAPAEAAPAPTVETHRFIEPPHKVERWAEGKGVKVRVIRGNRGMSHPSWCGRSTWSNRVTGCAILWDHKKPVIRIYARHGAPRELINNSIKHELAHVVIDRKCGTYAPSWVGDRVERVTSAYADKYLRGSRYWLANVMDPRPYSWDYDAAEWIKRYC